MSSRLLTIIALLGMIAPVVPAHASKGADREVTKIVKEAQLLLSKLEYQRARELLEASVRKAKYRTAGKTKQAKMWALLGRARAELGDTYGTDEAFLTAVKLNPRVKLPRSTSPKILAALERARINAPLPDDADPPPPDPKPPPPDPITDPKTPDPEEPVVAADPLADPEDRDDREDPVAADPTPTSDRARPDEPWRRRKRPKRSKRNKRRKPTPTQAPSSTNLRPRIVGKTVSGAKVRLVVEHDGVPDGARIEAMVRRGADGRFEPIEMTRTGTIATLDLDLDREAIDVYVRAKRGSKVLAAAPSPASPLMIQPMSPPSIADAWAAPPKTKTSTTVAMLAPPVEPPPASPPGVSDTEIWVFAGVGAVVIAAVTVVAIVLATGGDNCKSEEGFGCVQVQVLPLLSF